MNALATITYGDRRALANALRALVRKPGRIVLWLCWFVAVVGVAWLRTRPYAHVPSRSGGAAPTVEDLWVAGTIGAFGLVLAGGMHRFLGIFSSRAEALFLTSAQLPPAFVATYLQVRAVLATLGQGIARFALLVVLAPPAGSSLRAFALEAGFFAASGAAIAAVALPRAMLRGPARAAAQLAGAVLVAAAAIPLLAQALRAAHVHGPYALALERAAWHPGRVLIALGAGDLRAIAIPLAVALAAGAAFVAVARDRYPELYAISLSNLEWRARRGARRSRADAHRVGAPAHSARGGAPPGALVFVWADAIGFARRASPLLVGTMAALALTGGVALALIARSNAFLVAGLLGTLPMLVIGFAATSGVRLAPLLRLPLFWLGDVPLAARLAAWSFGGVWRDLALLLLGLAGYAAVGRTLLLPSLLFACGAGFFALTRSLGVAVFALFPNVLDQRGPVVVVRTLLIYVMLAPPFALGALAIVVHATAVAAALLAALVALFESAALIGFAAWRLEGRVDALAAA